MDCSQLSSQNVKMQTKSSLLEIKQLANQLIPIGNRMVEAIEMVTEENNCDPRESIKSNRLAVHGNHLINSRLNYSKWY